MNIVHYSVKIQPNLMKSRPMQVEIEDFQPFQGVYSASIRANCSLLTSRFGEPIQLCSKETPPIRINSLIYPFFEFLVDLEKIWADFAFSRGVYVESACFDSSSYFWKMNFLYFVSVWYYCYSYQCYSSCCGMILENFRSLAT